MNQERLMCTNTLMLLHVFLWGEGGLIKKLSLCIDDDFLLDLDNEDQADSEEMLGHLAMLI